MDFEALYLAEKKQNAELLNEVRLLREQVEYLTKKLFSSHSEKTEAILGQLCLNLFDEVENEVNPNASEPTLETVIRKKRQKGCKELKLKDLPHEKIIHDLDDEDMICSYCGTKLSCIGEEFVRTEVIFHPAKLTVIDHYVKTYECRHCRNTDNAFYRSAYVPNPVIPHSVAHPSSIAYVMYQKFVNHMPLYRQEEDWKNMGLELSRQTMSNWICIAANDWLKPILEKMKVQLLSEGYIHADETPIQVLNEENKKNTTKSYMWVFGTIKESKTPIRIFTYSPTRNGNTAKDFLKGFHGYLTTDAYDGYEKVEDVTRCYCWAHLRRYFVDALPTDIDELRDAAPVKAIEYCNRVFEIEREIEELDANMKKEIRQKKSKPIVDEFFLWLESNQSNYLSKSKLGKAITYALNQKIGLMQFLNDGNIPLSNNIAENAIRPFTVGRKNWLFSGNPKGADASAIVYSIVETAKANGLNPYKYLLLLLQELPNCDMNDTEFFEELMPWNDEIQQICK